MSRCPCITDLIGFGRKVGAFWFRVTRLYCAGASASSARRSSSFALRCSILHATECPKLAEADISANGADSRFDPETATKSAPKLGTACGSDRLYRMHEGA